MKQNTMTTVRNFTVLLAAIASIAFALGAEARLFHTEQGRWTRRDPLGYVDGMNLYGHSANGRSKQPRRTYLEWRKVHNSLKKGDCWGQCDWELVAGWERENCKPVVINEVRNELTCIECSPPHTSATGSVTYLEKIEIRAQRRVGRSQTDTSGRNVSPLVLDRRNPSNNVEGEYQQDGVAYLFCEEDLETISGSEDPFNGWISHRQFNFTGFPASNAGIRCQGLTVSSRTFPAIKSDDPRVNWWNQAKQLALAKDTRRFYMKWDCMCGPFVQGKRRVPVDVDCMRLRP